MSVEAKKIAEDMLKEASICGHGVRFVGGTKYSVRKDKCSGARAAWRINGCKYSRAEWTDCLAADMVKKGLTQ